MGKPQRVQLSRTRGARIGANSISVARPGRWGNPFPVERFGRERAIALFRAALRGGWSPNAVADLDDAAAADVYRLTLAWQKRLGGLPIELARAELRGKDLACWCPLVDREGKRVPCHADVLLEVANG